MATTMGSSAISGSVSGFSSDHLVLYENAVAPSVVANWSTPGKRLMIVPQFRLQVMNFSGYHGQAAEFSHTYVSPEPRLLVRLAVTPTVAVKAAVGLYAQPPDPGAFSRVYGDPSLRPQRGAQYVLGADWDITSTLHLEVAGFYKDLRRLVVMTNVPSGPPLLGEGIGRAFGGELLLRQQMSQNFFGWLSYTLSRSERKDHPGEDWHSFQFDQTHILTLIASRLLPKGFQAGIRFRYVTGNPTTPIVGSYFDVVGNRYTPLQGPLLSDRLPAFSQLDARVDKVFTFDKWRFTAYADIQNVLWRENAEAFSYNYNFTIANPVTGLPFLPVLGIRGDF
jgi:hypothetical protein